MKTLVLGLGNSILTDDGVGPRIAEELEQRLDERDVTISETNQAGLSLLDLLVGYERAIIIDAIQTVGGKAGQIYRLKPEAFNATRYATSPHDVNFATALEFGNKLGLILPRQIDIFAVEVADVTTFSEECTHAVANAVPVCAEMIIKELQGSSSGNAGAG